MNKRCFLFSFIIFVFKKVKRVFEFTGHKYSFKQNLLFLEETLNSNGFLKKMLFYIYAAFLCVQRNFLFILLKWKNHDDMHTKSFLLKSTIVGGKYT